MVQLEPAPQSRRHMAAGRAPQFFLDKGARRGPRHCLRPAYVVFAINVPCQPPGLNSVPTQLSHLAPIREQTSRKRLCQLDGHLANAGHPGRRPCIVTCSYKRNDSQGRSLLLVSVAAHELPKCSPEA
ncbi:hypothetical protein HBI56_084760 [Parastagonospora nodorum]|uniref:Uncharacterized protein n=1 Tax=Phaeosphaeria nodorum (strain SN15 / ATCC MYA-4574 / FGSC 10173) TaxID=321614 RepID=A0A7U2I8G0_PHANO|nr:hypothetical protein HBH56_101800 [Parastagonospora nodorum]QRD04473.1 hypothetical protein JI435_421250 [Parastagonospora nodorum SN15]KAH3929271.1 hypothetical protein HBH54_128630 [Parastagonospora nodorum]KAH3951336.1 hypothetical protein HBH53_062620 [Parastagonospora nodorum]KAH3975572.1 hypothetical protein HBH52_124230 [Parastagonospora nodorum]